MSNYKKTIGIEVHVELKTNNKIFSPSLNHYGNMANTSVNVIDLGYPGTLPIFNIDVLKVAIKACHVLNLDITNNMHFDRKNYFYPDNPKNFQITQFNTPIGRNGYIEITKKNGEKKKIEILEAHMEEDTCKSVHGEKTSLLDFNRAGVPLLEIVTKPCIHDSEEAVLYLEKLRELLLYSDVSDCKIEEGSMRCDANISISDTDVLGTKVEVKNIGSITNVGLAIDYEANRQSEVLEQGEKVIEETRRYDDKNNKTISMRVKETGNDYRYFPEPDLPNLVIDDNFISDCLSDLKTMPDVRREKYKKALINEININKIIQNKEISDYLENFENINLVIASNLLLGDISSYLNKNNKSIYDTKLTCDKFLELVNKLESEEISNKIFKDILEELMETEKSVSEIIKEKGISLVSDEGQIRSFIIGVLENNAKLVDDYRNGNERASKALMGQVMKESRGSVAPNLANKILMEILNEK
ncbi:MAG: Asp-tRNA(Asn)/Glu-tRNA(Gln) amidotransferase subunit GatB [Bacilli bacterium]|nr:Asp-tRNA(Asn)/Glu-tRNA(Gln) amidotransferase subunit GatB [Bacilli bacterium]